MKPKAPTEHEDGLLEYLEDIIGTSQYKGPIDESLVEMERLQEERQIKLNRLRHVEKEKTALEAKKKEAENYLRLKNEYIRALSLQYQWFLWKGLEAEEQLGAQIVRNAVLHLNRFLLKGYVCRTKLRRNWRKKLNKTKVTLSIWNP